MMVLVFQRNSKGGRQWYVSSDLKQDILDAIEDINDLLISYEALFLRMMQREPDNIELAARGTVLHSFYNGVEGIFLLVSKQIDKNTPIDSAWHQSLMSQMTDVTEERKCHRTTTHRFKSA
jgi:hypothetical protein